ncbi:MAG: bacterial transcriptional activator domain-containing protein, partial [Chloroflexi bacterium]|nr:bacterial transcriptional activator domain-containing protein [Chloroflexota bacterium]
MDQFRQHVTNALEADSADDLEQALRLYSDEFLSGMPLLGTTDFDEWLRTEREELRGMYLLALRAQVDACMRRGRWSEGVSVARRLVEEETWLEEAHCQLMLMLARSGQRQAALDQYEACRRALREELAVEPQPETRALFNRLRSAPTRPRHNLPSPSGPLIGRVNELRLLSALLAEAECRLMTISAWVEVGKRASRSRSVVISLCVLSRWGSSRSRMASCSYRWPSSRLHPAVWIETG